MKADRGDLERINELKTNKVDSENTMKMIGVMTD
jgi:hypothetical protein